MRKQFLWPGILALVGAATPAVASFHFMQIEQVIGGVNGDTSVQAIQLRMRTAGQNLLSSARIRAWDAGGANPIVIVNFTTSVPVAASGSRVLIASATFDDHTSPAAVANFTMAATIPESYLAAGSLTFETDNGTSVLWRLSWGGASYTGSHTGTTDNDINGNFGPAFAGPLPSMGVQALRFTGPANAMSTNNAADYATTEGAATFINNAGASFTVTSQEIFGACCDFFGGSCVDFVTELSCQGDEQAWAENVLCAELDPPCPGTGACCNAVKETCTMVTEIACINVFGDYRGDGVPCEPNPCEVPVIAIVQSNPPNNAIDARQPSSLANNCMDVTGITSVQLTFDGDTGTLSTDDFLITTDPPDEAVAIMNIDSDGVVATLTFDRSITVRHWTFITHIPSGTSTRIGYLPGDVNNDRTASPTDVLRLIDRLNNVCAPPPPPCQYEEYQTDADRSGMTTPADILRVIDLLNGAGCYDEYNGATLPP